MDETSSNQRTTLSNQELIALATSGALDEIANSPGSIKHHIIRTGLLDDNGKVWRPHFFVIYQTGRFGPQNGFKLCLVHNEFEPEKYDFRSLELEIEQGTTEFIELGTSSTSFGHGGESSAVDESEAT